MKNSSHAIETYSGLFVDPFDPDPESISMGDIAHALSLQPRFNGHIKYHYSVAAHQILVCHIVTKEQERAGVDMDSVDSIEERLISLVHDGSENITGDCPSPIKAHFHMEGFRIAEDALTLAIRIKLGLPRRNPASTKWADIKALVAEARVLKKGVAHWRNGATLDKIDTSEIEGHWVLRRNNPEAIEAFYLAEYEALVAIREHALKKLGPAETRNP